MIESLKALFKHPTMPSNVIYLDFKNNVCVIPSTLCNSQKIRRLTCEEYLNLLELEKLNLHIPYILSLLEQE